MRMRQNRFCAFPSLIFLVPSLRGCDHIRPSPSSFRLEDETANVADDLLTRFDSFLVRVAQNGLEGVISRSFFGQLICPFVASSHEASSIIQLGSLSFGQVRLAFRHRVNVGFIANVPEAVPDSSPHVSVRSPCRRAPLRPTFQTSEHCRTIRYERCSWFRQDDGLPQCTQLCPQDAALHWERDRHGTVR